jgi:hypothetical protein
VDLRHLELLEVEARATLGRGRQATREGRAEDIEQHRARIRVVAHVVEQARQLAVRPGLVVGDPLGDSVQLVDTSLVQESSERGAEGSSGPTRGARLRRPNASQTKKCTPLITGPPYRHPPSERRAA